MSDEQLVELWKNAGHRDAIARILYSGHADWVEAFFNRKGLSEVAPDLTQETFIQAFKALEGFRGDAKFSTWLYQIAQNNARRELRGRNTLKRTGEEIRVEDLKRQGWEPVVRDGEPGNDPQKSLIEAERLQLLRRAIQQLTPEQQRMVRLRIDQGRTDREIAVLLDIPLGTVKSRWATLRKKLEKLLQKYFSSLDD